MTPCSVKPSAATARPAASHPNLHRLALVHGFRAAYTVLSHRQAYHVMLEWVGDHGEYDRLFGYRTS